MEVTSVILCLFAGLLFLSFSFSLTCDWDDDCPYNGQWCCKYTETGKKLEMGLCVSRNCGAGVCRTQADCRKRDAILLAAMNFAVRQCASVMIIVNRCMVIIADTFALTMKT